MEMFTHSLSTPLRIWWKPCKRFTFTTLSRVHFSNSLYGWWGYMIFTTTFSREIFVLLNIVNMLLSPEKSGCDSSSDSVMAFQGTVVNKNSCRASNWNHFYYLVITYCDTFCHESWFHTVSQVLLYRERLLESNQWQFHIFYSNLKRSNTSSLGLFSFLTYSLNWEAQRKENSALGDMNVKMFHLSKKKQKQKQNKKKTLSETGALSEHLMTSTCAYSSTIQGCFVWMLMNNEYIST